MVGAEDQIQRELAYISKVVEMSFIVMTRKKKVKIESESYLSQGERERLGGSQETFLLHEWHPRGQRQQES